MCVAAEGYQEPMEKLIACVDISLPDEGLARLRELSLGCPACILAALLQCGAHRPGYTLTYPSSIRSLAIDAELPEAFDFKAACAEWRRTLDENAEDRREARNFPHWPY